MRRPPRWLGSAAISLVVAACAGDDPKQGTGQTSASSDSGSSESGTASAGPGTLMTTGESVDGSSTGCADPSTYYPDTDGDGFGDPEAPLEACTMPADHVPDDNDCDDDDIEVNPDADEVCDEVDNDCDDETDEDACDADCGWTLEPSGRREWGRCDDERTWEEAEAHCQLEGGALVSLHSASDNAFAINVLLEVQDAWIGLTDMDREGTYVWSDGTAYDYLNWDDTQPDDPNGSENCGEVGPSRRWFDTDCDTELPFICARPPR